jgi:hypothetical protein
LQITSMIISLSAAAIEKVVLTLWAVFKRGQVPIRYYLQSTKYADRQPTLQRRVILDFSYLHHLRLTVAVFLPLTYQQTRLSTGISVLTLPVKAVQRTNSGRNANVGALVVAEAPVRR